MKAVSADRFYRLFYPQVPVVVVAESQGTVGAIVCASAMAVSTNPPLVALSMSSHSHTLELIHESKRFSVNWLDYSLRRGVDELGFRTGRGLKDKVVSAGLKEAWSENSIPYLAEAVAHLDCELQTIKAAGDHFLVIGRVLRAEALEDFKDYWAFKDYRPILYLGSIDGHGNYLTISP